jgi:hypothetical protein
MVIIALSGAKYEGESNENIKILIKIGNTSLFYCKFETVILMV